MTTPLEKFQNLLRELFQFDCADLDFGIYRIMNHKRDVIDRFITQDLPKAVAAELDRGALADQSQAAKEVENAIKTIHEALGEKDSATRKPVRSICAPSPKPLELAGAKPLKRASSIICVPFLAATIRTVTSSPSAVIQNAPLFLERNSEYDYMVRTFTEQLTKRI